MRQARIFLSALLFAVLLLGACSQPSPQPLVKDEPPSGEGEQRPGIRPPLPVEPEEDLLEGRYYGVMYTGPSPMAALGVEFEPIDSRRFEGFACAVALVGDEYACNFVEEGEIDGDDISFWVGALYFGGKRIGETLNLSFYSRTDITLAGTVVLQPSEEEMPEGEATASSVSPGSEENQILVGYFRSILEN